LLPVGVNPLPGIGYPAKLNRYIFLHEFCIPIILLGKHFCFERRLSWILIYGLIIEAGGQGLTGVNSHMLWLFRSAGPAMTAEPGLTAEACSKSKSNTILNGGEYSKPYFKNISKYIFRVGSEVGAAFFVCHFTLGY
jgi:hypothetical protein